MRKAVLSGVVFFLISGLHAFAQGQDFSKVQIKVQKVSGTVYMLEGAGGNIGASVGNDGIVVVDDEFLPLADKIEAALKGITDKPVKFVLNTHWHGDHTGGNPHFGEKAPIIAQENVRKRLSTGGHNKFGDTPPAPKTALPVITFEDKVSVHLNGEDIRAIHFPNGHTDGDSVIFFPQSNVVHMGDDFFNGNMFPFIDLDSGGSVQGMIAGDEKVLAEVPDDVKIIPGHGPLATKDDLRKFIEMLKGTSAAVQSGIKAGKNLDQLKKDKVLAQWDSWGHGFINTDVFTEVLYDSLTKAPTGPKNDHGHMH
ncbi:MAG TPA: MBL fold metallo-hydrolase [Candidatus Angelobacter sp.]|jgi:glyoxylase-like metal-dependent hydrolase (beta-lactamase superfamily II)|nr:MBL fold metallo-hydrolase [Candidatus Angelobacter sp.]